MTAEGFLEIAGVLPEPLFLVTRESDILAANPAALKLLRRRSGELDGKRMADLVANSAERVEAYLKACARSTQLTVGALTWCASDGQRVETRTEGARVASGDAAWILLRCAPKRQTTARFEALNEQIEALSREVAERRQTEEELRRSRHRLQSILDNSATVIYMKDSEGRYILINRRYEEVFHVTNAELEGKTDYDIFPAESAEALQRNDRMVMERGQPLEFEETVPQDGGAREYLSLKFPVRDPVTGRSGVCGISTDITERKRLDEQLRETQKLESLGVLAGGVAHDFNNLLTGIMGNASLALESTEAASPAHKAMAEVLDASERAAHLTRQMLAYAGKGRFVVEQINLTEAVRDISNLVRISIPKNVELRLDTARDLPPVEADPGQIQQLVMNLVINGAEAVPEDRPGTVLVTTGTVYADGEYIRENFPAAEVTPGRYAVLEVHDTGTGMDEGTMARIFDPFFTTKFTGRGLGLSAVMGIVRGHRGAISVHSMPGRGTTFKVILPAAEPQGRRAAAERAADISGAGTVLVVDDEEIIRRTATAMLRRYGYAAVSAENGQEALDLFRSMPDQIALVLLDLTMPVMGGEEAFRRLRQIRPGVRVLLSSGYNEVEAIRRFTDRGIAGFIQKPYTAARLAEKVKSVLGRV